MSLLGLGGSSAADLGATGAQGATGASGTAGSNGATGATGAGAAIDTYTEVLGGVGFQNNWVNVGAPWETAGYSEVRSDGRVFLKGAVASGTAGQAIYTLPAGKRPKNNVVVATAASAGIACLTVIQTDGQVIPNSAGGNSTIGFDGVSFIQGN